MISDIQSREWLQQILNQRSKNLPARNLVWLQRMRQGARKMLEIVEIPNRKQEMWRYNNVEKLLKILPNISAESTTEANIEPVNNYIYTKEQSYRLVFVNGRCAPELSNISKVSCDVSIGSLRSMITMEPELIEKYLGKIENKIHNAFSALNRALIHDGVFVFIPSNVKLDKPIEILHMNRQADNSIATHARNIIVLEKGAEATIIEHYVSADNAINFYNGVSELSVGKNAKLTHYCIHEKSNNSYHLDQRYVSQLGHSRYSCEQFSTGAIWAKTDINVTLNDSGAECELNGLYIVGDHQLNDIHLNVVHKAQHCNSLENFKGIMVGKGRAVFDGRIFVDKDAQKSNAHLSNKNLILTRDAEVDTKPQLEIMADDVKCSHGTTVGQLDPNQIFYMRSRGLSEDKAKELLCLGFAGEVIDKVGHAEVQTYVQNVIRVAMLPATEKGDT